MELWNEVSRNLVGRWSFGMRWVDRALERGGWVELWKEVGGGWSFGMR